jgi:flagellar biogenesis protein FliO
VRFAARRGLLGAPTGGRHLQVLERLALDPRRSLYLVRFGSRALLLGASEEGLRALGEVPAESLGAGDMNGTEIKSSDQGPMANDDSREGVTPGDADAARGGRATGSKTFREVLRGERAS